jgi:hypothetical protein
MYMNPRKRIVLSTAAVSAAALILGACFLTPANASVTTQTQVARDNLANCQLLASNSTGSQLTRANQCITDQNKILRLLGGSPTPTPPATTPPTASPTVTPTPTPTATTTPPPSGDFPNADNTGVPAGTVLTPWDGTCSGGVVAITTPNLLVDARSFPCNVTIRASGVRITRSRISGWIDNTDRPGTSFALVDSEVSIPTVVELTVVGNHDFSMLRVEVTGGNRGVYCQWSCDIRDSWIHGQRIQSVWHASAVRMEQQLTLVHNTLVCDAQPASEEGTCSASLTGYGDFAPVRDNLIQGNYFAPTVFAAYCAYGGSSRNKPFSDGAMNNRFIDNVFGRGDTPVSQDCAKYGPVGDYDRSKPGNVWSGNKFTDGVVIPVPAF